jgi:hypothetical protein
VVLFVDHPGMKKLTHDSDYFFLSYKYFHLATCNMHCVFPIFCVLSFVAVDDGVLGSRDKATIAGIHDSSNCRRAAT